MMLITNPLSVWPGPIFIKHLKSNVYVTLMLLALSSVTYVLIG